MYELMQDYINNFKNHSLRSEKAVMGEVLKKGTGESTTLPSILNIACLMRPYSFTTRLVNWILASVDWND